MDFKLVTLICAMFATAHCQDKTLGDNSFDAFPMDFPFAEADGEMWNEAEYADPKPDREFVGVDELSEDYKAEFEEIRASLDEVEGELSSLDSLIHAIGLAYNKGLTSVILPDPAMGGEITLKEINAIAMSVTATVKEQIEDIQAMITAVLDSIRESPDPMSKQDLVSALEVSRAYLETRITDLDGYRAKLIVWGIDIGGSTSAPDGGVSGGLELPMNGPDQSGVSTEEEDDFDSSEESGDFDLPIDESMGGSLEEEDEDAMEESGDFDLPIDESMGGSLEEEDEDEMEESGDFDLPIDESIGESLEEEDEMEESEAFGMFPDEALDEEIEEDEDENDEIGDLYTDDPLMEEEEQSGDLELPMDGGDEDLEEEQSGDMELPLDPMMEAGGEMEEDNDDADSGDQFSKFLSGLMQGSTQTEMAQYIGQKIVKREAGDEFDSGSGSWSNAEDKDADAWSSPDLDSPTPTDYYNDPLSTDEPLDVDATIPPIDPEESMVDDLPESGQVASSNDLDNEPWSSPDEEDGGPDAWSSPDLDSPTPTDYYYDPLSTTDYGTEIRDLATPSNDLDNEPWSNPDEEDGGADAWSSPDLDSPTPTDYYYDPLSTEEPLDFDATSPPTDPEEPMVDDLPEPGQVDLVNFFNGIFDQSSSGGVSSQEVSMQSTFEQLLSQSLGSNDDDADVTQSYDGVSDNMDNEDSDPFDEVPDDSNVDDRQVITDGPETANDLIYMDSTESPAIDLPMFTDPTDTFDPLEDSSQDTSDEQWKIDETETREDTLDEESESNEDVGTSLDFSEMMSELDNYEENKPTVVDDVYDANAYSEDEPDEYELPDGEVLSTEDMHQRRYSIIGITLGCFVFCVVIVGLLYACRRRARHPGVLIGANRAGNRVPYQWFQNDVETAKGTFKVPM